MFRARPLIAGLLLAIGSVLLLSLCRRPTAARSWLFCSRRSAVFMLVSVYQATAPRSLPFRPAFLRSSSSLASPASGSARAFSRWGSLYTPRGIPLAIQALSTSSFQPGTSLRA